MMRNLFYPYPELEGRKGHEYVSIEKREKSCEEACRRKGDSPNFASTVQDQSCHASGGSKSGELGDRASLWLFRPPLGPSAPVRRIELKGKGGVSELEREQRGARDYEREKEGPCFRGEV